MSRNQKQLIPFLLLASFGLCAQAQAGSPEVEAGRCLRWLDAFINRKIDEAASISVEQLRPEDIPDVYIKEQRTKLAALYDKIVSVGSSNPELTKILEDHVVKDTSDIIKVQLWTFHNISAYVGCVSYPGTDNPWNLVVNFDDTLDTLIRNLEIASQSRVSSPPTR